MLLFGIIQAVLLISIGIYAKEEAVKYIDEASFFIQHLRFSQPKYFFYSGYISLHILCKGVGATLWGVYIIQLILAGIATNCFYSLAFQISSRRSVAFISTVLLILCLPFQEWTVYLFTESFFFSLLIFYVYALFNNRWSSKRKIIVSAILFCALLVSRPTGLLIIPPTLFVISAVLKRRRQFAAIFMVWIAGLIAFVVITNAAMSGQGEFDFLKPFIEEHIICGYSQIENNHQELVNNSNTLQGVAGYIMHHFGQASKLAVKRIIAFFGLTRPYYSTRHNLFLALYFYPIYLFAIVGIAAVYKSSRRYCIFSIALIGTFLLSVAVTCDDWHNRFIMPLIPLIILFAGNGIYIAIRRFSNWAKPGLHQ
jgi:hypothetical protein